MMAFVVLSAVINLVMGSASAKWAIMAPVFIPMFMLLGTSPELVQVAYRIGDSTTNVISPMMSYFALIVAFIERYDKNAGIGTVMATMLPYTVVFMLGWMVLLGRLDRPRPADRPRRAPCLSGGLRFQSEPTRASHHARYGDHPGQRPDLGERCLELCAGG